MGCARRACRVSLNPSTRRSPPAWAWASRSAARLSKPMVGGCGRPGASRGALSFSLRSPLTEPPSVIDVAYWQILLQKSKIEEARKSREDRFLDAPAAARLSGANTKVGGHFGMKRCGPSCRHTRNASAVFKIFVLHPKKTFATISARNGHGAMSDLSPLSWVKRKLDFCAVR